MRLHKDKPTNHRKATTARIVQTPTMARRPRSGAPDQTLLMAAVPAGPDFRDPSLLPGMKALTARDGITVILPSVREHWAAEDATTTQILPKVSAPLPPSARHVDPVKAYYEQTFVEDDGSEPHARGRHVLNELKALPDPAAELAQSPQRIIKALGGPEPEVKDPAKRLAVRLFRAARDMGRTREARCDQDDARLNAVDARIREFADRWAHDDKHWDKVARTLNAKQEATDASTLTAAYVDGGTEVALFKVDELAHEIARRALAGSAVAR